ncbi:MAG: ABC transporter permease [Alphaproteobacteria bacterium]|nr:ABC transporter permease [Alphaproteobacteria bacterium]
MTNLTATADSRSPRAPGLTLAHALSAMHAVANREVVKFFYQRGRLFSALVRPALWLVVFAAGFQNVFGVSIIEPYDTYVEYQVYVVPGLLGIVLLFHGMQSSLSMVYDREMGMMRLLLTAPLPRWYLLFCKLAAGTVLSLLQAYAFLLIAMIFGVAIPWMGWLYILPAMILGGLMVGSLGLLLSVYSRQLENFAGMMNFVIFPMFFLSTSLYPLWRLRESGAEVVYWVSLFNPFTHAVELIRFAAYSQFNWISFCVVGGTALVFFMFAAIGYDPQRGFANRGGPRGG